MADNKVNPTGDVLGLLRITVKRGINLAIRDIKSSDPYVIVCLGKQKLRTRVIRRSLNPVWNEDLTLCITNPNEPVKLMGDAEFDIRYFMEAVKMNLNGLPDGTVITKVRSDRKNCIAEESCIVMMNGKVTQNMFLRLRNVECGEIELKLQWIDVPSPKRA
ncbi:hypothetical protein RND81_08G126800 [Saponaria officinalis]|uniref:C2 domain-containing protein n=1 Tax=Saponaria officinalis TaxID=3572 RepID=A0AAW1J707_SAPOF